MNTAKLQPSDVDLLRDRRDGRVHVVLGGASVFVLGVGAAPAQPVGEPRPRGQRRAQLQGQVQREPLQLECISGNENGAWNHGVLELWLSCRGKCPKNVSAKQL